MPVYCSLKYWLVRSYHAFPNSSCTVLLFGHVLLLFTCFSSGIMLLSWPYCNAENFRGVIIFAYFAVFVQPRKSYARENSFCSAKVTFSDKTAKIFTAKVVVIDQTAKNLRRENCPRYSIRTCSDRRIGLSIRNAYRTFKNNLPPSRAPKRPTSR